MNIQSINILLVEDCTVDARLIERYLTKNPRLDTQIERVKSLSDCLSFVSSLQFDVILTDLGLPDSQGIATISAIRDAAPGVPIVALTGIDDYEFGLEAIRNGADDFVPKSEMNSHTIASAIIYTIERFQVAEYVKKSNVLLEEKNRRLSAMYKLSQQFIDHVSHEFRTPLTVIREFASILRDGLDGPINENQNARLESLINRTDKLATMVEDLLDTSLLESGLMKSVRERHSLSNITKSVEKIMAGKAVEKEIELKIEHVSPELKVFCDEEKLTRILINLIHNAVKFTPSGGNVKVFAERLEADRVSIVVEDDGPGIAPEELQQIFDQFHQAGGHRRIASCKGFGLGLNIARSLAALNLGALRVASIEGQGSRFSVQIPNGDSQSILNCYFDQRAEDFEESIDSYCCFHVAIGEYDTGFKSNVLDCANDFLHNSFSAKDLVIRLEADRWLAYCNVLETEVPNIQKRLESQWQTQRRNFVHCELPDLNIVIAESGCLPGDRQRLEAVAAETAFENRDDSSNAIPRLSPLNQVTKVLIADDEPEMVSAISSRLEACGCEVKSASNGFECLHEVSAFQPDAIVLDIQMPELDGLEVLKRLKLDPATASIPVVMLSAVASSQRRALKMGASYFIQKPFLSETLLSALNSASMNSLSTFSGVQS